MKFIVASFLFLLPFLLSAQMEDSILIEKYESAIEQGWEDWNLELIRDKCWSLLLLCKKQQQHTKTLSTYNNLIAAYYYQNNLDSTKYYLQLVLKEQLPDQIASEHESWLYYDNLRAVYAYRMGDFAQAATITESLLKRELAKDSINYNDLAITYNNLGTYYDELGDYTKAKFYLQRGLQITRNSSSEEPTMGVVEMLNTLGHIEEIGKNHLAADSIYQAALTVLKQLPDNEYNRDLNYMIQQNKALNFLYQNKYAAAQRILQNVFDQLKKDSSSSQNRLAFNHTFMGRVLFEKKQYADAQREFEKGLEISYQTRAPKHPRIAELYDNLGENNFEKGNLSAALKYFQQGLVASVYEFNDSLTLANNPNLDQTINSKFELSKVLRGKASALYENAQSDVALQTIQLNIALLDSLRINYLYEGSKLILLENAQKTYELAIQIALDLNRPDLAFEYFERSKAALLLDNIKRIQANQFANLPDSTLQQERDFKVEIAYQERQLLTAQRKNEQSAVDSLRSILFEKRQHYQQFLTELEQNNPRYYQLKYDTEVASLAEVQKELLQEDDLLLTYFMGEEYLYVLAISPTAVHPIKLANPKEILTQIEALRQLISQPKTGSEEFVTFNQLAHQLYEKLIDSTAVDLLTANKNLLILPAAELGHLPFQVLLKNKFATSSSNEPRYDTLSYLIKNHPISYGFSATLLLESTHNQSTHSTNFAGFAPVFNESAIAARSRNQLGKLTHSLQEIQGIQQLMQGDIFINENANVTNFREQLANYNILHLATHAQLSNEAPNDSRIYFHDDYLTAAEIYNLSLQADLVVLSACETGTGKLQRGEGLISLARAFAYANCPSLVTSLWQIDDATTADLMVGFYQNLQDGQTKPQALQTAQVDYLQRADISYQQKHPFYWGAFVQIGERIAIRKTTYGWWLTGCLLVIVLLGTITFFLKKTKVSTDV